MFSFLNFLRERDPIYAQIKQFHEWKSVRQPFAADSQKKELLLFVRQSKIRTVTDISVENISLYQDTLNGEYFQKKVVHALRQFFSFCQKAGYANIQVETRKGLLYMEKIHPLLDVGQVLRVKELRARRVDGVPMSYRKIKAHMEKQDKRTYDVKNIYKWANYKLPQDFDLIPNPEIRVLTNT